MRQFIVIFVWLVTYSLAIVLATRHNRRVERRAANAQL
jgi:hypothetical protein